MSTKVWRTKVWRAWALEREFEWGTSLLGRLCWEGGSVDEDVPTRLFRTRAQAREAKKTCFYGDAKVVPVEVEIRREQEKRT